MKSRGIRHRGIVWLTLVIFGLASLTPMVSRMLAAGHHAEAQQLALALAEHCHAGAADPGHVNAPDIPVSGTWPSSPPSTTGAHAATALAHGHGHGHGKDGAHHHHHGGLDPHAWQDAANVRHYVENISKALCEAVPADCEGFRQRAAAYDRQVRMLDREIHQAVDALPENRRRVMVGHAAFGYFGRAYGIEFLSPQGVSTEAEPSAAVVARLVRQAREQNVRAFFLEYGSDPRLMKRMAAELDKRIPIGELYSDTLSAPDGPAPDYLSMMRANVSALVKALSN
ncbi:MAG: zinc ABC transporter substrate-binding protein [Lautropia sp.]|nr:zinc ABC transporter substrate-binding protein [Lautropia sp.]